MDKPWLKYYSSDAAGKKAFEGNIWENIYECNKSFPDDIALIYFGKKISYGSMFEETDKAAAAFAKNGVKKKDIVVLCMAAIPETIYSILALNKLGACVVILNPMVSEEQTIASIKETDSRIIVVLNELYDSLKNVLPSTQIEKIISVSSVNCFGKVFKFFNKIESISGTTNWKEFISEGNGYSFETAEYLPDEVAVIVNSSGTTGVSKGIQLTNFNVNCSLRESDFVEFGKKRQDVWLNPVPIWFSTGICASVLFPLKSGMTVILEPDYDFKIFYKHILKYKPNFIISASGLYQYLSLNHPKCKAYRNFKYLVCGGEKITSKTEDVLNEWLLNNKSNQKTHKGYGMCELGGPVTATSYNCNVKGSAGIPTPNVIVSAFDAVTNKELKYGERGEIRILTESCMKGYYKNSEATDRFFYFDDKGRKWCCTGDMGYISEEGSVYVCGRIANSYVADGKTIFLFDIENAVLEVDEIKQCKTVVSLVNGKLYHVCHIVVDDSNDVKYIIRKVRKHCEEVLQENHLPSVFKIHDNALPVALSGKLDVDKLRDDVSDLIFAGE